MPGVSPARDRENASNRSCDYAYAGDSPLHSAFSWVPSIAEKQPLLLVPNFR